MGLPSLPRSLESAALPSSQTTHTRSGDHPRTFFLIVFSVARLPPSRFHSRWRGRSIGLTEAEEKEAQTDRRGRASAARLSLRIGGGRGRGASASIRVSEGQSRLGGRKGRRERGMAKGFSPRCRRRAAATSNAACGCLILMAAFIVNLLGSDAATASASAAAAGERSPRRGR